MGEVMLSEFDYFSQLGVSASLLDEFDDPILPSNTAEGRSILEFVIPGNKLMYRDLSNTMLTLTVKVVNTDGTNLANTAVVAPANNILHSLFKSVQVTICGTTVSDTEAHYPYRAFIESLLTYEGAVHKMRSPLAGWELDVDADSMDRIAIATANAVEPNPAFKARNTRIATSRALHLAGRIHADIFHQNLDIPPDCPIVVRLTPSDDTFALMCPTGSTFKFVVSNAKLLVRSKTATPELVMAHRDMMVKCNIRMPYNKVELHSYVVPQNVTEISFGDIFRDRLPKRIVLGLLTQTRGGAGAFNLNPFKFENHSVNKMEVSVDAALVPRDASTQIMRRTTTPGVFKHARCTRNGIRISRYGTNTKALGDLLQPVRI
jgi:hypothetical protein